MSGGVKSCTTMSCKQLDELLHSSVAVHVRSIVKFPAHNGDPGRILSAHVITGFGSQPSVVAAKPPVFAGSLASKPNTHSIS